MDVPYLIHVPDGDELWLVDGEQRLLITPRIYDLLASNGADLPPAYGIEELRDQNAKLRELVRDFDKCLDTAIYLADSAGYQTMPDQKLFASLHQRMCELGIEAE